MEHVSEQHLDKIELSFEKRLNESDTWQSNYGFPYGGFSLSYFQFDKAEYFGNALSVAPYYSFLILGDEAFGLRLRTGVGLGWIERFFDLNENYKNVAIGSNLNLYFSVLLQTHLMLSENWGINAGVEFSHFSNTGARQPNLGINLPSLAIGLIHQFGESTTTLKKESNEMPAASSAFLKLRYGHGIHQIYPVNGPTFLTTAISAEWSKVYSPKSLLSAGLDLFYNPGQIARLKQDSVFLNSAWENLQMGISATHLFRFGKFAAGLKLGWYLKKEDPDLTPYYSEVIGQYELSKKIGLFTSLKTHLSRAEYALFGLQYKVVK